MEVLPLERWEILIISLVDATKRRDALLPHLNNAGLRYKIIDAVDGRSGLTSSHEKMCDRTLMREKLGRELADTEIACALSHRRAYEYIVRHNLPGALILEDDTVWSEEATSVLEALYPGEVDFIQLDYGLAEFWRFSMKKRIFCTDLNMKRLARNAPHANSYIVSRRAASFILKESLPIHLPADWPCDLRPLKPMAVVPRVCSQSLVGRNNSYLSEQRLQRKSDCSREATPVPWFMKILSISLSSGRNPRLRMPYSLHRMMTVRSPAQR